MAPHIILPELCQLFLQSLVVLLDWCCLTLCKTITGRGGGGGGRTSSQLIAIISHVFNILNLGFETSAGNSYMELIMKLESCYSRADYRAD